VRGAGEMVNALRGAAEASPTCRQSHGARIIGIINVVLIAPWHLLVDRHDRITRRLHKFSARHHDGFAAGFDIDRAGIDTLTRQHRQIAPARPHI